MKNGPSIPFQSFTMCLFLTFSPALVRFFLAQKMSSVEIRLLGWKSNSSATKPLRQCALKAVDSLQFTSQVPWPLNNNALGRYSLGTPSILLLPESGTPSISVAFKGTPSTSIDFIGTPSKSGAFNGTPSTSKGTPSISTLFRPKLSSSG